MVYARVSSHRSMVFDAHRNDLYAKAIRELITPQSVVLDLGAGLGIHGLIAAAANVKKVYMVEPEPVIRLALEVAKSNGLADRVDVFEGAIERIGLPEQVDLIVSVFTGDLLYSEDLLPSLFYARDRYLKPGGRMVPDRAELVLAPVSAPEIHEKYIACWAQPGVGIDFSSVRRFAANDTYWLRREESKAVFLAEPAVVSAVDLMTSADADCNGKIDVCINQTAHCHGLMAWIKMRLGQVWLSTSPEEPEVHWAPVFLPLDPPLELQAGEKIVLGLNRPAGGDWTWTLAGKSGTRRHSSFLSRPDGPERLKMFAPDYRPALGQDGELALQALAMMRESNSNRDIALALLQSHPGRFKGLDAAMQYVQGLVKRFSRHGTA